MRDPAPRPLEAPPPAPPRAPAWVAPVACLVWLATSVVVGDVYPFARVDTAGAAATRPRIAVLEFRVGGRAVDMERFEAFEGLDPDTFVVPGLPAAGDAAVRRARAWVEAHPAAGRDPAAAVAIEVGYRWLRVGEGAEPGGGEGAGEPARGPGRERRREPPRQGGGEAARVEPPPPDLLPGGIDPAGESWDLDLPPEAIDQPKPAEGAPAVPPDAPPPEPEPPPGIDAGPEGWTRLAFGVAWERR